MTTMSWNMIRFRLELETKLNINS